MGGVGDDEAHPGVRDDEKVAEEGRRRRRRRRCRGVDEVEVDEAFWSWRVRPRETDGEEEEDTAVLYPCSGHLEMDHGDGDGR